MKWIRCPRGHYYDVSAQADCPHCLRLLRDDSADPTGDPARRVSVVSRVMRKLVCSL